MTLGVYFYDYYESPQKDMRINGNLKENIRKVANI